MTLSQVVEKDEMINVYEGIMEQVKFDCDNTIINSKQRKRLVGKIIVLAYSDMATKNDLQTLLRWF